MINFTYEYKDKLVFGDLAIGEWFQDRQSNNIFRKISDAYGLPLSILKDTFPDKHSANLNVSLTLFLGEHAVTRCDIEVNVKESDDQDPIEEE